MKPKRKQKPKAGKVVRLTPPTLKLIDRVRAQTESIDVMLRRVLGGQTFYLLPESSIITTNKAEAKGLALQNWVKRGKRGEPEEFITVKEIK